MDKKKLIYGVVSVLIAGLTIFTIVKTNEQFSIASLLLMVSAQDFRFVALSALAMFGFIFFEGYAIIVIARGLGYRKNAIQGILYGASDIYFSAITPSASGGQPASAYFMIRDGIPASVTTVILLLNLIMYTAALLIFGLVALIFHGHMFVALSAASKFLIIFGAIVLTSLMVLFYMLIKKEQILFGLGKKLIRLGKKLHILRKPEKLEEKMNVMLMEYKDCAEQIQGKSGMLLKALFWNLMQRFSQILVPVLIFLSAGKPIKTAVDMGFLQCFTAVGSNVIPIPGAMGVADFLLIDGLQELLPEAEVVSMELLCRGMTFYGCVVTGAVLTLIGYIVVKHIRKNKKEK